MIRRTVIALLFAASVTHGQDWRTLGALWSEPSSTAYTPTALANLRAWWTFASGDGSSVPDMRGTNTLAQSNAAKRATVSGGYASFLGGTNSFYAEPSTSLNLTNEATICFWARFSTSRTEYFIQHSVDRYAFLTYAADSGKMSAYVATLTLKTPAAVNSGNWVHLATTYTNGTTSTGYRVYTNGNLAASATSGAAIVSDLTYRTGIGAAYDGTLGIIGDMDDIRIYDRRLSDAEITAIYNEGRQ